MNVSQVTRERPLSIRYKYTWPWAFRELRWLSEWRIASNVSKSTAIIFGRAGRRFIQPRPVTLFVEPIHWVDKTRYLGWLYIHESPGRLTPIRSGRGLLKEWVSWVPSWLGRVVSPSGTEFCYISSSSAPWWTMRDPLPAPMSGGYRWFTNQESSPRY